MQNNCKVMQSAFSKLMYNINIYYSQFYSIFKRYISEFFIRINFHSKFP